MSFWDGPIMCVQCIHFDLCDEIKTVQMRLKLLFKKRKRQKHKFLPLPSLLGVSEARDSIKFLLLVPLIHCLKNKIQFKCKNDVHLNHLILYNSHSLHLIFSKHKINVRHTLVRPIIPDYNCPVAG